MIKYHYAPTIVNSFRFSTFSLSAHGYVWFGELSYQLTSLLTPATAWSTFASISFKDTFHSPPPSLSTLKSVWSLWSWPGPASQLEPPALWKISGRRRNRKILRVMFFCLMPAWVRERKVNRGSRPFFLPAQQSYHLYAWSSEAPADVTFWTSWAPDVCVSHPVMWHPGVGCLRAFIKTMTMTEMWRCKNWS